MPLPPGTPSLTPVAPTLPSLPPPHPDPQGGSLEGLLVPLGKGHEGRDLIYHSPRDSDTRRTAGAPEMFIN